MYNTKNKTQKAYKKNKPNLNLIPENCVCVFPIEIVGGKTQVSNLGIMPNRKHYNKGSFLYWQEVFDGRSALKLQWEGSITLEKPEGQNYYLARQHIGSYYYGKPISNGTEQLEISEDASFEDFMSMKASQTVTLRFEYSPTDRTGSQEEIQSFFRFVLTDNDIYNLYLIPELCEEKLMYISEHQEYYDDLTGQSKGCEITFSTLGDKIQKSGKAIEQYCSWNAPGEFSVRPVVNRIYTPGSTEYEKEVSYDINAYYYPTPIKYLQVEQQGPALTSTMYALGRRQEWDETEQCWKIGPSKFLLPFQFITTQPNPLNRTATPSKNYCCFEDEQVSMVTTNEWLKWTLDTCGQPLEQVKNAGMITIGRGWNTTTWYHPSNTPVEGTHPTYYDYYDNTWHPITQQKSYTTDGCVYAENTIDLLTSDTMIDVMCKNAFIYNQMPLIPLSMTSTKPFYLRNIPVIGAIANFLKLGDIHVKNNTLNRQASHLCFFGDADLMAMCARLNGQIQSRPFGDGTYCFPINFFGTNETMYQKLGVNAVNTTFCVQLTDQVQLTTHGETNTYDTVLLGQSMLDPQVYIFDDHKSLLVNSSLKPVTPGNVGYIIDAVIVQSIFDGKIRLSCYGPEERDFIYPQWTATILSNANWENGNLRDWTNVFFLSNWEDRFCVQQDSFTWPEAPHKEELDTYKWVVKSHSGFDQKPGKTFQETDSRWTNSIVETTPKKLIGATMTNAGGTTNPRVFYNQTIPYSDFGIETITDKDSFLSYFKSFDTDITGSFITLNHTNPDKNTYQVKAPNVGTIDLTSGVYTYTKQFNGISLRGSGPNNYDLPVSATANATLLMFIRWLPSAIEADTAGHFTQNFILTLTLDENGVNLTLTENSSVYGYSERAVENKPMWAMKFVGSKIVFDIEEGVNSIINIDHLLFHKR